MQLTKANIQAALPAFRGELLEHCPSPRHVRRLDRVISTLKRKGLCEEHRLEQKKGDETEVTIAYAPVVPKTAVA